MNSANNTNSEMSIENNIDSKINSANNNTTISNKRYV